MTMEDQPPRTPKKPQDASPKQTAEIRLESSGEVVVEHHATPPAGPLDKKIHPRRRLPLIPNAPSQPPNEDEKDV